MQLQASYDRLLVRLDRLQTTVMEIVRDQLRGTKVELWTRGIAPDAE